MNLLVTGSLAFDRIAVFNDRFGNHILPDAVRNLNVAFMIDKMSIHYGGTAGNIAYNLALLESSCLLLATAGFDFEDYERRLKEQSINTSHIKKIDNKLTAHATIMTDMDDNQITAFYPGAMMQANEAKIEDIPEEIDLAIIAPNGIQAMEEYAAACIDKGIKYISDPGQSIPAQTPEGLKYQILGAHIVVANDYEWKMIEQKTGLGLSEVLETADHVIITHGAEGSRIYSQTEEFSIPAIPAKEVVDPTGCGDAFRAGLMYGIKEGYDIRKSTSIGAWVASKCVEKAGTQNHTFKPSEFNQFKQSNGL